MAWTDLQVEGSDQEWQCEWVSKTTKPRIGPDARLVENLERFREQRRPEEYRGFLPTGLHGVQVFWTEKPVARTPLSYEPGIAIIASGQKVGFSDDKTFHYNSATYLVVGAHSCFECESIASSEEPLIGLFVRADPEIIDQLSKMLGDLEPSAIPTTITSGIEPLPVSEDIHSAVVRLTQYLSSEAETHLLGPQAVRELLYRVLCDRHGRALLAQSRSNAPAARIARLLRRKDVTGTESLEELSKLANMGLTSFRRHFKALTGTPPKKFFQRRRLHEAKRLMVFEGAKVGEASFAVGYTSSSQFSREFKDLFGVPPSEADAISYNLEFDG